VTRARANASSIQLTPQALSDPEAMKKFQAAQAQLSGALSRLLVTVERYPDLKANQGFLALQTQLEGTENRISVERQRYNDAVRAYNVYVRRVPNNIIAGMFGFHAKAFFEAAPDAATPPRVKF
jgi:LemA protein